jgi:hypothetical protein
MARASDNRGKPSRSSRQRKRASVVLPDPYQDVSLWVGRPRTFDVEGGGLLRVDSGQVAASFRLRRNPDPTEGETVDTASCLVRLADQSGEIWESVSTFSLNVFVENMINLDSTGWLVYFDDAKEWKPAFDTSSLMTGAVCLLDDRFYRKFLVGDERVELKFKYQSPTFDVAYHQYPEVKDFARLIVRVSGLFDLEMNEIRPLAYEMDWQRLFFKNDLYYDEVEGGWTGDGLPLPLVFNKTGGS